MSTKTDEFPAVEPAGDAPVSRLQLVWDVTLFQFTLVLDGLRDVLLSPLSIGWAIIGLAAGGDQPDRTYLTRHRKVPGSARPEPGSMKGWMASTRRYGIDSNHQTHQAPARNHLATDPDPLT
jgi:hypothetical protein